MYKELVVKDVAERLASSPLALAVRHGGLTVAEMESLRTKLHEAGGRVLVLKRRLAALACRQSGREALADVLDGQVAFVFGEDIGGVAKTLADFAKENQEKLSLLGGVVEGRFLGAGELAAIAALPSRGELLAMVVGALQAPVAGLVRTLAEVPAGLVRVLDAVAKKRQEQSG